MENVSTLLRGVSSFLLKKKKKKGEKYIIEISKGFIQKPVSKGEQWLWRFVSKKRRAQGRVQERSAWSLRAETSSAWETSPFWLPSTYPALIHGSYSAPIYRCPSIATLFIPFSMSVNFSLSKTSAAFILSKLVACKKQHSKPCYCKRLVKPQYSNI